MDRKTCLGCTHWWRLTPDGAHGECRRNAPLPRASDAQAVWPITFHDDACGQYVTKPEPPAPIRWPRSPALRLVHTAG